MKSSPSPLLAQLADFLCERRDFIMQRWLEAARGNTDIQNSAHLSTDQLSNHLPDLLGDLAETLRTAGPAPTRVEARKNAKVHGRYRWQQDYRLDELLRELNIIRRLVLRHAAGAFFRDHVNVDEEENQQVHDLIERFFEDTAIGSVEQFVSEQQERLRESNDQLQEATRSLKEANTRLSQADAARLLLVRTVAHDLRNILNALSAAVSVLGEEADEAERARMQMVCHRNFADMSALLKELLDYSVVLANPRREVATFSPFLLLDELSVSFRPMAQARGLSFAANCDPTLTTLETDRLKLKQIVTNLLANALKYRKRDEQGGSNGERVTLSFVPLDSARWMFVVEDEGIGIAPEDCARIFDEFQRVSPQQNAPGTGLGLAIVKRLVEQLEGHIEVHSQPGQGSRFEVTLPLALTKTA